MPYNLDSPNKIGSPISTSNPIYWALFEINDEIKSRINIMEIILNNISDYISWPEIPILFWEGCDRIKEEGKKQKYHTYTREMKE